MRTTFRKSFARDLKKVKDQAILDRVREIIETTSISRDSIPHGK